MMPTIALLVEADDGERDRLAEGLREEGWTVLACTGPSPSGGGCPAEIDQDCRLAQSADVVVLDQQLETDMMLEGMPGWQLLQYYIGRGFGVVVIVGLEDPVHPLPNDRVAVVRRSADLGELLDAMNWVTRGSDEPLVS